MICEEDVYIVNWTDEEDKEGIVVRLFGYNRKKESVMIKITDYSVFCYLELPHNIDWKKYLVPLSNVINNKFRSKPLKSEFEMKKKLYNPTYKKVAQNSYKQLPRPYLKVYFKTVAMMKDFIYQTRSGLQLPELGKVTVNVFGSENSLTPCLRLIGQRKINPVGWVKIKQAVKIKDIDKESSKKHEYFAKYTEIHPYSNEDSLNMPRIFPSIFSFDIETYSSKLISMPDAELPKDCVFQIGVTFRNISGKVKKILLTLKECDEIEDTLVIKCKSERLLLIEFAKLVTKTDPDIIIGYNIYGFDYKYIIKRAEMTKCLNDFMKQGTIVGRVCKQGEIEWESSAFGVQKHSFVDAEGRLIFDMLPYMKRSFKLSNYRLETVCDEFLKTNKDPLKYRDIFECYEKGDGKSMALCGKYCTKDSYVVYLLFEKLCVWYDIAESANTNQVPMFYLYAKGQQIKMFSQVFSFCNENNIVMNIPRNLTGDKYTGATVLNPVPGIYNDIIPFDFASLYPSIIMAYNIDYSTYVDDSISDDDCHIFDWEEHVSCEHDPNKKEKKRKLQVTEQTEEELEQKDKSIICNHFKHRFAKSDAVGKGVIPTLLDILLTARKNVRKDLEKIKLKHKLINLYFDNKLSKEYNEDLDECLDIKELIKNKDNEKLKSLSQEFEVQKSVLDKRQLAYKVNANSMYGAMGVSRGFLPFVNGAMTVTYVGRTSIKKAVDFIQSEWKDSLVVYGDTDSCFVKFSNLEGKPYKEIWQFAEQVVDKVKTIFPAPMKLEFEGKIYSTYFILSKKRYVAQPCDINGVKDKKLVNKGVVLQRRDNCKFLKDIYEHSLWKIINNSHLLKIKDGTELKEIMKHPVVKETIGDVIDYINKLFCRTYTNQDFVITKGLNRVDYKGKRKPAHACLADKLGKRGITVPVNTRLEYVLLKIDKKDKLQEEIIEEFGYFKEHKDVLRIDFMYYLGHQVMKPLDEIFKVAFKLEKFVQNHVKLRENKESIQRQIRSVFSPRIEIED